MYSIHPAVRRGRFRCDGKRLESVLGKDCVFYVYTGIEFRGLFVTGFSYTSPYSLLLVDASTDNHIDRGLQYSNVMKYCRWIKLIRSLGK